MNQQQTQKKAHKIKWTKKERKKNQTRTTRESDLYWNSWRALLDINNFFIHILELIVIHCVGKGSEQRFRLLVYYHSYFSSTYQDRYKIFFFDFFSERFVQMHLCMGNENYNYKHFWDARANLLVLNTHQMMQFCSKKTFQNASKIILHMWKMFSQYQGCSIDLQWFKSRMVKKGSDHYCNQHVFHLFSIIIHL